MPELVGDAGYAQEPGLLSPAQERTEAQWAALTSGIDHDADVIPSPRVATGHRESHREPSCKPDREPDREPSLSPATSPPASPAASPAASP